MAIAPAAAQPQAWARYQDATDAAERGEHKVALPLLRAARLEAEEPALTAAICFGIGHSVQALLDPDQPDKGLACEGRDALQCFLDSPRQDAAARARAERDRKKLDEICSAKVEVIVVKPPEPDPPAIVEPVVAEPPPPDNTTAWWLTGSAVGAVTVGGVLLGLAVADANEVRERDRVDTEDLEQRAQIQWATGWTLVGAGFVLGGLAWWQWSESKVAVGPQGVQWSYAW